MDVKASCKSDSGNRIDKTGNWIQNKGSIQSVWELGTKVRTSDIKPMQQEGWAELQLFGTCPHQQLLKVLLPVGIKTNLEEVEDEWLIYQCFNSEKATESK